MTNHGTILLIEDGPDDVLLFKKAFSEAEVHNPLQTVNSYEDAVKYLTGEGIYADRAAFPLPFLILLDLRMPGEGGFAVLRWLYERPGLKKKFGVIVFSGVEHADEIQLAYELGAHSFLFKPLEHRQLVQTVRSIKDYWIDLNIASEN